MSCEQIVFKEMVAPFFEKEPRYIGAEIETILFSPFGNKNNKEAADQVFRKLIQQKGFQVEITGTDGFLVRVSNGKDAISCDYSYQLLEFSMGKDTSISAIEERFYDYCSFMRSEFAKMGFIFTGMATNHFRLPFDDDEQYTHDPFYTQVRKFVLEKSSYKDPAYFYPMMASAQSHIEVRGEDILKIFNLFNRLDFVRAMLFSNSLPNTQIEQNYFQYPEDLICARDILWDNQALPNTGVIERDFSRLDDLVDHISNQKIFVNIVDGSPVLSDPIDVREHLKNGGNLSTYRSFEHVVINQYHVVEVRSDCTQPLRDAFSPLAFNLGVANNWQPVYEILDCFYSDLNLPKNNAILRRMAITQKIKMSEANVKLLLHKIVECAEHGLIKRGLGEEKHLKCLYERIENGTNPALDSLHMLEQGYDLLSIAKKYSEI